MSDYLGFGVYASAEGDGTLRLSNGYDRRRAHDTIYLDDYSYQALVVFRKRMVAEREAVLDGDQV